MKSALVTVKDRFFQPSQLRNIPSPEAGRQLVAKRFALVFSELAFEAPYPTWPIHPDAFRDAPAYTARTLLQRAEEHIRTCWRSKTVRELYWLDDEPAIYHTGQPLSHSEPASGSGIDNQVLDRLDAQFTKLRASGPADL